MTRQIDTISDTFYMTDDMSSIDVSSIHALLSNCYWRKDIDTQSVRKFIANSYCVSILNQRDNTIAFARLITDYASYGFITDVVVDESYRRQGLARKMIDWFLESSQFEDIEHWSLITTDESIGIPVTIEGAVYSNREMSLK